MGCSSGDVSELRKTLRCDYISKSSRHVSHFHFRFSPSRSPPPQRLMMATSHLNVNKGRRNQPTTTTEDGTDGRQYIGATHFILFFVLLTVSPSSLFALQHTMPGHLSTTAPRVAYHRCTCRTSTTTCVSFYFLYIRSGGSHHHVDHHTQHIR